MAKELASQYSILIVSSNDQFNMTVKKVLPSRRCRALEIRKSASAAKRELLTGRYDIVIVNAPLTDEMGMDFVMDIHNKYHVGIILAVPAEIFSDVSGRMIDHGILTISKPVKGQEIDRSLRLLFAFKDQLKQSEKKILTLEEKMEELRTVSRAKILLVQKGMTEDEAHSYILKQSMDRGLTKRAVAEEILE